MKKTLLVLGLFMVVAGSAQGQREPWTIGKFSALSAQGWKCIHRQTNTPTGECKLAAALVGAYLAGLMDAMELESLNRSLNGRPPHFCVPRKVKINAGVLVAILTAKAAREAKNGVPRTEIIQWKVRSVLLLEMAAIFPCNSEREGQP